LLDSDLEILSNIGISFEFSGVLKGQLEYVVKKFYAVLPVLLQSISLVQLLEFVVVGSEILAGHDFV
jgi:hypothetical protein